MRSHGALEIKTTLCQCSRNAAWCDRGFSLMFSKLLLCLSSPNFPSDSVVLYLTLNNDSLKVRFVVYYVMTKMGAIE